MTKNPNSRHPLIGILKDVTHIPPGVDLTEPADPYWGLDLEAFKQSLADPEPPRAIAPALAALWWAAKGDWERAHKLVMDCEGLDDAGREAAWVHGYLHRVEGDLDNAGYWYRAARQPSASGALEAEWDAIVTALLARNSQFLG